MASKSLFFIMQSTLAYEATARTIYIYIHLPVEYPFAGVRIKANTDKSIINARLHTQRETAKKRKTENERERESASITQPCCKHFKQPTVFKDTAIACIRG